VFRAAPPRYARQPGLLLLLPLLYGRGWIDDDWDDDGRALCMRGSPVLAEEGGYHGGGGGDRQGQWDVLVSEGARRTGCIERWRSLVSVPWLGTEGEREVIKDQGAASSEGSSVLAPSSRAILQHASSAQRRALAGKETSCIALHYGLHRQSSPSTVRVKIIPPSPDQVSRSIRRTLFILRPVPGQAREVDIGKFRVKRVH